MRVVYFYKNMTCGSTDLLIIAMLLISIASIALSILLPPTSATTEAYRTCRWVRSAQGGNINQEREVCDNF